MARNDRAPPRQPPSHPYYYLTQALRALDPEDPRRFAVLLEREPILRAWGRRALSSRGSAIPRPRTCC
ncbi:hypothetical protein [Enhygromyxa salina]|uniref:hypothetical protein n=1 Tax=Enhygromyxa salina TaxID=215803 RepID=UPI0011BA5473|nr:hypothetical protein [Enhygromyxa salina]